MRVGDDKSDCKAKFPIFHQERIPAFHLLLSHVIILTHGMENEFIVMSRLHSIKLHKQPNKTEKQLSSDHGGILETIANRLHSLARDFNFQFRRVASTARRAALVFAQNCRVHIERRVYRAWNWCIRLELVCRASVGATVSLKKMERRVVFAPRPFLVSLHVCAPCAWGNRAWCNDRRRLYHEGHAFAKICIFDCCYRMYTVSFFQNIQ